MDINKWIFILFGFFFTVKAVIDEDDRSFRLWMVIVLFFIVMQIAGK